MPPSLRKACQSCTLAKRRCEPQLPKCSRCLKNGLACIYDLEPLKKASESTAGGHSLSSHVPSGGDLVSRPAEAQPSYSVFTTVSSAYETANQSYSIENGGMNTPEIRIVADQDVMRWAVSQLRQIPDLILQGGTSPFVHAQLYSSRENGELRMQHTLKLHRDLSQGSLEKVALPSQNAYLVRLTRLNVETLSFVDVLLAIHQLALYLVIYSCNDLPSIYHFEAQQYLPHLMNWGELLWTKMQDQSQRINHQPLWQSWLAAESARRSVLACHLIKGAISIMQTGYCVYSPFLEALPFDPRQALWEAMSEGDWEAAVARHGGRTEMLVSWREFIESSKDLSNIKDQGIFQKMLLVSFYGKEAVEILKL